MVIYDELFAYGMVSLTSFQKRLVKAREGAAQRQWERTGRWASQSRAKVAAQRQPVTLQDLAAVQVCSGERPGEAEDGENRGRHHPAGESVPSAGEGRKTPLAPS